MHIFYLELQRILKTRRVCVMLAASVILSILLAFAAIHGVSFQYVGQRGQVKMVSGLAAVDALRKENNDAYVGPVTVEKLRQALSTCQDVYRKYGDGENIPANIINEKIAPIQPFLDAILAVYFPDNSNGNKDLESLNSNQLNNFYSQQFEVIKNKLENEYPENQNVLQQAEKMNAQAKIPFTFEKGNADETAVGLSLLTFLLVAIGIMITAPNFSSEYQNGADDIFRCTKYGHRKFVVAKLFASLIVLTAMFFVCSLIFTLLVDSAVGWNSFQTSVQFTYPTDNLVPMNFLQAQSVTFLATFLSLLATGCLSLFISTKCRNSTTALIISIAIFMIPVLMGAIVRTRGIIRDLLTYALPGGSVGFRENFYSQLVSEVSFTQIGPFSVWVPYLMLGASMIEIPVFFILAIHTYCKHQTV